jgi:hypothetical protein
LAVLLWGDPSRCRRKKAWARLLSGIRIGPVYGAAVAVVENPAEGASSRSPRASDWRGIATRPRWAFASAACSPAVGPSPDTK